MCILDHIHSIKARALVGALGLKAPRGLHALVRLCYLLPLQHHGAETVQIALSLHLVHGNNSESIFPGKNQEGKRNMFTFIVRLLVSFPTLLGHFSYLLEIVIH